jgi:hypothetical protein
MSSTVLRIENAESVKPENCEGDLYLTSDQIVFVAYRKSPPFAVAFLFFNIFTFIAHGIRMNKWRDSLKGKTLDQLAGAVPHSWSLKRSDIVEMRKRFPATLIIHTHVGKEYRLSVPLWRDFKEFATKHSWPLT